MASKPYTVSPARRIIVKDPETQQALDDLHNAVLPHTRANQVNDVTYGTTCTLNLTLGNIQTISVTDSHPFTISAPLGVAGPLSKYSQIQPNAAWTLIITNDTPLVGTGVGDGQIYPTFDPSLVVKRVRGAGAGSGRGSSVHYRDKGHNG